MKPLSSALCILILASISLAPAGAKLTHRYTFEDGTAKDTIGQIDGTLVGCGAIAQGHLVLYSDPCAGPESESFLVFSDSPLPTEGSVSLVAWFTVKEGEPYTRIFDFGSKEGAKGRQFLYFSPRTADGSARVAISATDIHTKTSVDFPVMDDGEPHMIAVVVDGNRRTLRVFADGKPVAKPEYLGQNTLEKVNPRNCWLGKSLFSDNPLLNGSIDEFRVYDHALGTDEIESASRSGPNRLPPTPSEKDASIQTKSPR